MENPLYWFESTTRDIWPLSIKYRILPQSEIDTDTIPDIPWKTQILDDDEICEVMNIRVPIHLKKYLFQFSIQTINVEMNIKSLTYYTVDKTINVKMDESLIYTVNIPTYSAKYEYKLYHEVMYRSRSRNSFKSCSIHKILDDDTVELVPFIDRDESESRPNYGTPFESDVQNIAPDFCSIFLDPLIDLVDHEEIERNLLIQREDQQSIDIFNSIKHSLSYLDGRQTPLFLTKNIFDFLYEAQFHYNVLCLEDSVNHKHVKFGNIHQKYIGHTSARSRVRSHCWSRDKSYECDKCTADIFALQFSYSCGKQHIFCLNCINTVITIHGELMDVLNDLLKDILIKDCIQCITDYVVGGVICTKYKTRNDMKRQIDEMDDEIADSAKISTPQKKKRRRK